MRPGKKRSLSQLLDLQEQLYSKGMAKDIPPTALAQVARAWSELEERKRILRMKPKPKDVDVSELNRKLKPPSSFLEVLPAQAKAKPTLHPG